MKDGSGQDIGSGRSVDATSANPLEDRAFVTTSVIENGVERPLVKGTQLRLAFPPGRISAEAGCNIMNAEVVVEPDRLVVSEIASTKMACEQEREQQDRLVAEFLAAGPAWALTHAGLTLTARDIRIDLTEEPSDPAQLWGSTFVATAVHESGIVPAPVVEGTEIVLTFTAPDRLTAQAGCNIFQFAIQINGNRLLVDDRVASTRMACSDELQAQDEWLVAFLVDDPEFSLYGDSLTLTRGSTEIVLERRPSRGR